MRLEIWHKIGHSALQTDVFAQCYALIVVHATIGLVSQNVLMNKTDFFCLRSTQDKSP